MTTLLWFSRDLRLTDNPALAAALTRSQPIIPLFILDDEDAGDWPPGGASRWWLHASLAALGRDLAHRGSHLVLRRGKAEDVLDRLLHETSASAVYWNRRYEPWAIARTGRLKIRFAASGIDVRSFNGGLIHEPWTVKSRTGEPYRVFTPFRKALETTGITEPALPPPPRLPAPERFPQGDDLSSWSLRPAKPDWAAGLRATWTQGEQGAHDRLRAFAEDAALAYRDHRDRPAVAGTSRLSPNLHFGEIGPRQVWRTLTALAAARTGDPLPRGVEAFLSEIAWREFSHHLLFHFPMLPNQPLRPEFSAFPWRDDQGALSAWQRGMTGYPIVDAGMRELWTTGWMHNRVRMIVASFLAKDLLVDWRQGEAWFWDTLVDADLANNAANWQWVAGCGADAAPYFRIFNPSLQGAKFDPDGAYVRRWVPELARLPNHLLHAPWDARPLERADAGITTYPSPIVDHAAARNRALAAFNTIKTNRSS